MESQALHLGGMMCARVCHDLGGLAGTLASALELAEEDGGREAIVVAREAADALACKLRMARAVFGPSSDPLGAAGIADLAGGLGERVKVDASGLGPEPLPAGQARLALAMLMLGAEALPAGGIILVAVEASGALRVAAHGPRAAWRPGVVQGLAGAVPSGPRDLLAPLCALLAGAAGMGLVAEEAPPTLRAVPLARRDDHRSPR